MNKGLVVFSAVVTLFFTSCNRDQIEPTPTSTSSQLTIEEARQMIQGSWYCYKRETIDGPICAGGANETRNVYTFDQQYTGFKLEFTDVSAGVVLGQGQSYELYYDGGNGATSYAIVGYDNTQVYTSWFGMTQDDLLIRFGAIFLEGYGYEVGFKIVSLNQNELVVYTLASTPTLLFFRRSNQTEAPYNVPGLSGNFILDHYTEVSSGIVSINEQIDGGTYSFTNEIYQDSLNRSVMYLGNVLAFGTSSYFLGFAQVGSSGFSYEVSNTHLFSYDNYFYQYKVVQLNTNELIVRDEVTCNNYKEYHLTKIN